MSNDSANVKTLLPAKTPLGRPIASGVGSFLALLIVALGAVGLRDALVGFNLINGTQWLSSVGNRVDGLRSQSWMVVVGALFSLLGLWLIWVSMKPRAQRSLLLQSASQVQISPLGTERMSSSAAREVDGVLDISVKARKRGFVVIAKSTNKSDDLSNEIRSSVEGVLAALSPTPKVDVKLKEQKS